MTKPLKFIHCVVRYSTLCLITGEVKHGLTGKVVVRSDIKLPTLRWAVRDATKRQHQIRDMVEVHSIRIARFAGVTMGVQ